MGSRKRFTREFKLMIVGELEAGKSAAELSRTHSVHTNVIHRWRREYESNPDEAFAGQGNTWKLEAKLAEKDRLIGKLYAENELLKKSIANWRLFHKQQKRKDAGGFI